MIVVSDMQVLLVLHQDSTRDIFQYICNILAATLLNPPGDNVHYRHILNMYAFVLSDTVLKCWLVICV